MDDNVYYHFLSYKHAREALENRRIKVGRFNALNDPFEMMPYRRFRTLKERQPYNKVFQKVSKKWGLLCFSPNYVDQLLWAHYADSHKGIALGFEIRSNDFFYVKYSPNKIRSKIQLSRDPLENERQYLNLAKVKYEEWIYEKEHRILVKLDDCVQDKDLFFVNFGQQIILKRVVLGSRFDHKSYKNKVLKLKKKLNFEVIATRPGWEDYKIHKDGTRTNWYQ